MWTFIIILSVVFFVLAIGIVMVACLKMAGKEDEWLMRQMEEKSIENADMFVHDGEPIGKVISVQNCKNITSLMDEEFQSCTSLKNAELTILGIDLTDGDIG